VVDTTEEFLEAVATYRRSGSDDGRAAAVSLGRGQLLPPGRRTPPRLDPIEPVSSARAMILTGLVGGRGSRRARLHAGSEGASPSRIGLPLGRFFEPSHFGERPALRPRRVRRPHRAVHVAAPDFRRLGPAQWIRPTGVAHGAWPNRVRTLRGTGETHPVRPAVARPIVLDVGDGVLRPLPNRSQSRQHGGATYLGVPATPTRQEGEEHAARTVGRGIVERDADRRSVGQAQASEAVLPPRTARRRRRSP